MTVKCLLHDHRSLPFPGPTHESQSIHSTTPNLVLGPETRGTGCENYGESKNVPKSHPTSGEGSKGREPLPTLRPSSRYPKVYFPERYTPTWNLSGLVSRGENVRGTEESVRKGGEPGQSKVTGGSKWRRESKEIE